MLVNGHSHEQRHSLNVVKSFWDIELFVNHCLFNCQFVLYPCLNCEYVVWNRTADVTFSVDLTLHHWVFRTFIL